MNKLLFGILAVCCIVVYGLGQGWLGQSPADQGRQTARVQQELNAGKIQLLPQKP